MRTEDIIAFVSDGFEKAKGGKALEVYKSVTDIFDQATFPLKSHYPFGWIIYYALHQSGNYAIRERKYLLARYFKLSVPKPHKLHSMILTEAIRLYKDAIASQAVAPYTPDRQQDADSRFSIVKFMEIWDFSNLRPGDKRRKDHQGRQLPSTVEKLITCYVDELYTSHTPTSEEFMTLALQTLKDNPASDVLYSKCAQLYELAGNKEEGIAMLRKAILASASKFYLWGRLAHMISDEGNTRLTVGLLGKALLASGQEDFKGKIRIRLAKVMADAGSLPYAKWELDKVKRLYDSKGWHLPKVYSEILGKIPQDVIEADPSGIYLKLAPLAEDFVYKDLPDVDVKKTYHKPATPGKGVRGNRVAWRVTDNSGKNYWLQPAQFNLPEEVALGQRLTIKVFQGKVVSCKF